MPSLPLYLGCIVLHFVFYGYRILCIGIFGFTYVANGCLLTNLFEGLWGEPSISSFGAMNAELQSVKHVAVFLGCPVDLLGVSGW